LKRRGGLSGLPLLLGESFGEEIERRAADAKLILETAAKKMTTMGLASAPGPVTRTRRKMRVRRFRVGG
jgi:hypothetical protein